MDLNRIKNFVARKKEQIEAEKEKIEAEKEKENEKKLKIIDWFWNIIDNGGSETTVGIWGTNDLQDMVLLKEYLTEIDLLKYMSIETCMEDNDWNIYFNTELL